MPRSRATGASTWASRVTIACPRCRETISSRADVVTLQMAVRGRGARRRGGWSLQQITEPAPLPECGWSSRPSIRAAPRPGPGGTPWHATPGVGRQPHGRSEVGPLRHAPLMHQTASQPVEAVPPYAILRHPRPQCCPQDTKPGDPVPRRADRQTALRDQGVAGSNPVSPTISTPRSPKRKPGFRGVFVSGRSAARTTNAPNQRGVACGCLIEPIRIPFQHWVLRDGPDRGTHDNICRSQGVGGIRKRMHFRNLACCF
jgi:hypothetical protein